MEEDKSFKNRIKGLFEAYNLGDKYDEINVINSWESIVGKQIAQKTTRLFIQKGIMHLFLSSAPLKSELRYYKAVVIEKVNSFAKQEIIKDLIIH